MSECQSHDRFCQEVKESYGKIEGKLDVILAAQAARRERCASNEGRLNACEASLDRLDKEGDQQWKEINALKRLGHMAIGVCLVISILSPIATGLIVFYVGKGG